GRPPIGDSMIRRLIAYFIDWYIALIIMNTMLIAAAYLLTGRMFVGSLALTYFDADVQLPLLLMLVAVEVILYSVVPRFVWRGQTIGKHLLRVRMATVSGEAPGLLRLMLRDLVAITVVEGCFSPLSNYVRNYLMLFLERDIIQYTVWFSWGIGVVSVLLLLLSKRKRMLHDVIAGTVVTVVAPNVPDASDRENDDAGANAEETRQEAEDSNVAVSTDVVEDSGSADGR
ncbi:RDD family protein, partial [uncultured Enorma sp.]|uniref:RDD family protein n=1 Tax=uncultured Enorma sp. TaxID=1714346 RepID=UPI0025F557CE